MGFECVAAENHTGSRGVVALFRNNFEYKIHSTIRDDLGRYIVIDIEFFNRLLEMPMGPAISLRKCSIRLHLLVMN